MTAMSVWIRRAGLVGAIIMLGLLSLPTAAASASALPDIATPPAPSQVRTQRLAQAWSREQQIESKLDTFFNTVDTRISNGQALIDRAKANGKDVSTLQVALDAFSAAVKQAQPIFQTTNGIVAAHQGFDSSGNVTDPTKALETVQDLRDKFQQIRQILELPRLALKDAIQAFRQANWPSPTPTQPGA